MAAKKDNNTSAKAKPAPHYHGHRERLRGRFRDAGADALSDYEMLELVLFRAIPQRDVKPLAKQLIETSGHMPKCWLRRSTAERDQGPR